MSAFKTILAPMADALTGAVPLETSMRLAARYSGHVIALHVRSDPVTVVPLMIGESMGGAGALVDELISVAKSQGNLQAKEARSAFDNACARHGAAILTSPQTSGLSAEWIDLVGREDEVTAIRGRLSDLVVLGRPEDGDIESPAMATLQTVLMACGKPILLCPAEQPQSLGSRVGIAWNGSAEAARAVSCALPLLRDAVAVSILTTTENIDHQQAHAQAKELAAHLTWYGVSVSNRVSQATHSHVGEELLRQAASCEIDLLVMGANAHSRLHDLFLGSVTRNVISNAPINVLMCH